MKGVEDSDVKVGVNIFYNLHIIIFGVEDRDVKVGVNIFYNLHLIIFDEGSRGQGCNGWCKYILQFTSYLTKEGGDRVCLHFIGTS